MIENLLVVAGIDDKNHFESFIDECHEKGINAKLYIFGWQDKDTPLEVHEQRLHRWEAQTRCVHLRTFLVYFLVMGRRT